VKMKAARMFAELQKDLKRFVVLQGGARCFSPNQEVVCNGKSKKIKDVKVGDNVLSYDFISQSDVWRKVKDVLCFKNTKPTVKITLKNGKEIICTDDHKFYFNGGWVKIRDILLEKKKEFDSEAWKSIPFFSRYEASNLGRIRSLNYKNSGNTKILKPALSDGYLKTVLLNDIGEYKSWTVHKWICLAFLGDRRGKEVNHKNGIKIDNNIRNLEYVTRSENVKHAYRTGLELPLRGEDNPFAKLTNENVKDIREIAKSRGRHYNRKELAKWFGVSEGHIKDIITRRRKAWSHI